MIHQTLFATAIQASAEHSSGENPILEIARYFHVETGLLIAQIINFCVVAFLLYKFAFKPILQTIEKRQNEIAEGLQNAEEWKHKLAEAEKRQTETLREAQQDAQKIMQEARDSAKILLEKQTKEAGEKAQDILDKAQQNIEIEKDKMLTEVRQEVASLVVKTTEKVLNKELTATDKTTFSESAARELTTV